MIICLQTKIIVSNPQVIWKQFYSFFCTMRFFHTAVYTIHPNTMSSFSCLRSNDTENNAERDDLEGKNPSFVSEDQRNYFYFHLYYFDGFRKQLVMSQWMQFGNKFPLDIHNWRLTTITILASYCARIIILIYYYISS